MYKNKYTFLLPYSLSIYCIVCVGFSYPQTINLLHSITEIFVSLSEIITGNFCNPVLRRIRITVCQLII